MLRCGRLRKHRAGNGHSRTRESSWPESRTVARSSGRPLRSRDRAGIGDHAPSPARSRPRPHVLGPSFGNPTRHGSRPLPTTSAQDAEGIVRQPLDCGATSSNPGTRSARVFARRTHRSSVAVSCAPRDRNSGAPAHGPRRRRCDCCGRSLHYRRAHLVRSCITDFSAGSDRRRRFSDPLA